MPDASKVSLNLFRKNLMPGGLASIATPRLLNQCSARLDNIPNAIPNARS